MLVTRGEGHGSRVSRELFFIMDCTGSLMTTVCATMAEFFVRVQRHCPRQGEGKSSPPMVERCDTHCHVNPCVHDEALLFGANGTC